VTFAEAGFVLHCFQKKSKRGIATSKEDMDIIRTRLKVARRWRFVARLSGKCPRMVKASQLS
jgi:phage-related protein